MQGRLGAIAGKGHMVIGNCLLVITPLLMQFPQSHAGARMGCVFSDPVKQVFFRCFGVARLLMKPCKFHIGIHVVGTALLKALQETKPLVSPTLLG